MNWAAVAAIGSFVSVGGIAVLIFKAGALVNRVEQLEKRVDVIDRKGCGAASRLHSG
jgi:hypothetical protein